MARNRESLLSEFVEGKEKGKASSLSIYQNSKGTALYSYATPIAFRDKETGNIYATDKKFSMSTSKQQNALKRKTDVKVESNEEFKERLRDNNVFMTGRL